MTANEFWSRVWGLISEITIDDFNKLVLALVAVVALILGPWMQWRIAKRQMVIQAKNMELQLETQSRIATRQIADNISTKRQSWIDELRKDAAEFLTIVGQIQELKRPRVAALTAELQAADFKDRMTAEMRAKELGTRIRLRLNPNEVDHVRLIELIAEMGAKGYKLNYRYTPAEEEVAASAFNEASNAVITHLQIILKREWERVKKGDL